MSRLTCAIFMALMMIPTFAGEIDRFIGEWQGESVCVAKGTACNDETVVYRIGKLSAKSVSVSADKIVNGSAINMGMLEFRYDHDMLICEYAQGVWRLKLDDGKIDGTLTRSDGTVFRRVTLRQKP